MRKHENERVQVHELRDFIATDLDGAFQESYAISRGTKCKQFLFSLSLNPPKGAEVSDEAFLRAIEQAETKLGLTGQPRAVVFHEKRGDEGALRRHAHSVWSRINTNEMKAVQLSHSRRKLQDVSRDLYLEHGWQMPRGLAVSGERDPRNFSLAEWQQAKRIKQDPREIKAAFQDAWAISDNKTAFSHALQERGYWLCRDRRGYVAADVHGEVHNIAKRVGIKTREVKERIGDLEALTSIADAKRDIAKAMQAKVKSFQKDVADQKKQHLTEALAKRQEIKQTQKAERDAFLTASRLREFNEEQERQSRLRKGLPGLWDRLTGERKKTLQRNAEEAQAAKERDLSERKKLVAEQKQERQQTIAEQVKKREELRALSHDLMADFDSFKKMETQPPEPERPERRRRRRSEESSPESAKPRPKRASRKRSTEQQERKVARPARPDVSEPFKDTSPVIIRKKPSRAIGA